MYACCLASGSSGESPSSSQTSAATSPLTAGAGATGTGEAVELFLVRKRRFLSGEDVASGLAALRFSPLGAPSPASLGAAMLSAERAVVRRPSAAEVLGAVAGARGGPTTTEGTRRVDATAVEVTVGRAATAGSCATAAGKPPITEATSPVASLGALAGAVGGAKATETLSIVEPAGLVAAPDAATAGAATAAGQTHGANAATTCAAPAAPLAMLEAGAVDPTAAGTAEVRGAGFPRAARASCSASRSRRAASPSSSVWYVSKRSIYGPCAGLSAADHTKQRLEPTLQR